MNKGGVSKMSVRLAARSFWLSRSWQISMSSDLVGLHGCGMAPNPRKNIRKYHTRLGLVSRARFRLQIRPHGLGFAPMTRRPICYRLRQETTAWPPRSFPGPRVRRPPGPAWSSQSEPPRLSRYMRRRCGRSHRPGTSRLQAVRIFSPHHRRCDQIWIVEANSGWPATAVHSGSDDTRIISHRPALWH